MRVLNNYEQSFRMRIEDDAMSYFGKLYLDKEKDIIVRLDMERSVLSYTIWAVNHQSDNLINNLAVITGQKTVFQDGKTVITGEIPCYIKGDGQKVYIFRLNGTKVANIYPDGEIEVNSLHRQIREQLFTTADGFPQIHLDGMAEGQLLFCYVISGGAVIQQQGRIHGNPIPEDLGHGHAAAGVDGEGTAVFHKVADGLDVSFGNGGIRRSQSPVVIHSQQYIRKNTHKSSLRSNAKCKFRYALRAYFSIIGEADTFILHSAF